MFPVVIPVAGLGTRSLPASKAIPKEMLPLLDKPIIQYIVEEAVATGVQDIIFVTSEGKSAIEQHFAKDAELEKALEERGKSELLEKVKKTSSLATIKTVEQKEALGLGHAVLMAKNMVSSTHFFTMLGDEVTDAEPTALGQLLNVYESVKANEPEAGVVLLTKVPREDVCKYGICELESETSAKIVGCVEKPKPEDAKSQWAITGRYMLPTKVFSIIESGGKGKLGEIQLTDALNELARQGKLYACFFEGTRLDAGDRMGFLEANIHYYMKSEFADETLKLLKERIQ